MPDIIEPRRPRGRPPGTGHDLVGRLGTVQLTPEMAASIDAWCERTGIKKAEATRYLWSQLLSGAIEGPSRRE